MKAMSGGHLSNILGIRQDYLNPLKLHGVMGRMVA